MARSIATVTTRARVVAAALAVAALAGSIGGWAATRAGTPKAAATVKASDPLVAEVERSRTPTGKIDHVNLVAAAATVDLDGRKVDTWAFNGQVPGPEIRVAAGDVLEAQVVNHLSQPVTIHWHGISLRDDMDGVPGLTQPAIKPGGTFIYRFTVPQTGTYFYHSHVGTQLDTGLYGPLIVTSPAANNPPTTPDITMTLDDWIDGTGTTPAQVLANLENGGSSMGGSSTAATSSSGLGSSGSMSGMGGMGGMDGMGSAPSTATPSMSMNMPTADHPLGTDAGDVTYPYYLINGRTASNPEQYTVTPGERVRVRLINAGADTAFRVAYGGGPLTVVATDGHPVIPVSVDSLIIAMGERYDVELAIPGPGAFPVVAVAEGKNGQAMAVLRSAPGPNPPSDVKPPQLSGSLLNYSQLHATGSYQPGATHPDVTYSVELTGSMASYRWGLTGSKKNGITLAVKLGQRVRLIFSNRTMMWHPMHLHGHEFQVETASGSGPVKDTVIIPPMAQVAVDFVADNPGQWALHCHNVYHAEAGMMTVISYIK